MSAKDISLRATWTTGPNCLCKEWTISARWPARSCIRSHLLVNLAGIGPGRWRCRIGEKRKLLMPWKYVNVVQGAQSELRYISCSSYLPGDIQKYSCYSIDQILVDFIEYHGRRLWLGSPGRAIYSCRAFLLLYCSCSTKFLRRSSEWGCESMIREG